jgi:hypothetical protein
MRETSTETAIFQRLAAVEEIKGLKARYFRCLDLRDWAGMHDVFATDAVMDMREEMASLVEAGMNVTGEGLIIGRDEIIQSMSAAVTPTRTVHHGHMPEIELLSDSEATGVWAMEDVILFPPGSPKERLQGYGHYHEAYARGPDSRWRIAKLRLTRLVTLLT